MEVKETAFLWEHLKNTNKPIALYGMGDGAEKILDELEHRGISVYGIFASDEFCRNQQFRGFGVVNYAQAKEMFGEMIVLVAFGTQLPEVIDRIKKIAQEQELYVPDTPVAGSTIFDKDYFENHEEKFEKAYAMLADEMSRKTFLDVLYYKISGKPEYLFDCERCAEEAYQNILKLGNEECYVDVGAYTGDTVKEFMDYVDGYKKIFAVEPDPKNFAKLSKYAEQLSNIRCYNVAAHETSGEITFSARAGRNSVVNQTGTTIPAVALDHLLKDEEVTYIKYDVEGEEIPALKGTCNIIEKQKPKLLVSAYHRNEDLFEIPFYVKRLNPSYQVYLRHYPYIPAWDTNYYFIPK